MAENHVAKFMQQAAQIAQWISIEKIDHMASALADLRSRGGRLFFLGVGGSAGNCGHAVNDFRKLCHIEAYAPTDNVSELTARTNDEGWHTVFCEWLKVSRASSNDAIFVLSVGGGSLERAVSPNLVKAVDLAAEIGMPIFGIVGRDGGHTARRGQHVVIIPTIDDSLVTPHSEAFQAVVWHCLVSHPILQLNQTKW